MRIDLPRHSALNAYDLEEEFRDLETARFALLPIPYERTTTYAKGTARGPEAFLSASQQVELYDPELDLEPFRAGIYTAPFVKFGEDDPIETCLGRIRSYAEMLLSRGKCVVGIGGEHTVSLPLIEAYAAQYKGLQVLQLDAHADLRDEFEGSPLNHACVMRRVEDMAPHVGVGIRSLCREEAEHVQATGIQLFYARDLLSGAVSPKDVVAALDKSRPVYVTIDLDCFDPSEAPGVGTPEPGGLGWYEVVDLIAEVIHQRKVVGFDVVELRPLPDGVVTEFLAAKLVYRIFGLLETKS